MGYFFPFDKLDYVSKPKAAGCILCKIRDGSEDVPNLTVHTGEFFIVTLNLYPYNPGHIMIFPSRHLVDIREYSSQEKVELDDLSRSLLDVLDETHHPAGYNIGYNMGLVSVASIDHIHLHIIPRYPNEIGIADLIAGKRVLVEDPKVTLEKIRSVWKVREGRR